MLAWVSKHQKSFSSVKSPLKTRESSIRSHSLRQSQKENRLQNVRGQVDRFLELSFTGDYD